MVKDKLENLRAQIKKAEEDVIRKGDAYNQSCEKLKALREKEAAIEHDKLIAAFIKSGKTYEEVMAFLGPEDDGEEEKPGKRRGRPRRGTEK